MSATALSDLKVYELKAVCRAKGLKVSGRKAELVERIRSASVSQPKPAAKAKRSKAGATAAPAPTASHPATPTLAPGIIMTRGSVPEQRSDELWQLRTWLGLG